MGKGSGCVLPVSGIISPPKVLPAILSQHACRLHFLLMSLFVTFVILSSNVLFVVCQSQHFRVLPRTNIEVIQGSDVTLNCAIAVPVPNVQWSKNGFLLGFNRSIPGYPRYSMVGDARDGVHNLRIVDVRLEDDGEYQCQVGPGSNSRGIRANSRLNVLLRPASIDISGHSNGSHFEARVDENVNLECVVSGGKPAAQIKWFRRGLELRSDHVEVTSAETATSTYTTESDAGTHELTITRSTLRLKPRAEDNGIVYTCEASHPALPTPMRATTILNVVFPPGPPEITGYVTGDTARMGDVMTLTCKSRGGNPLAQLVWYKNNEQVDFSYNSVSGKESVNDYTFTVDASDNNAIYRCEASSPVVTPAPMVSSVKMTVHFAPSKVVIKGPKEARAGDNVTMVCKTARSNPASDISWVVDGRPFVTQNTVMADPAGGFVTSAEVSISITSQDRNMKLFSCYAVNNALGETVVETSVVSILSPPDPPSIFGYQEATAIRAGSLQRLTCVVNGGNPPPTLKWFVGDDEIKSGIASVSGQVVSSELSIVAKDSDNGAEYRCEASNSATGDSPLTTSVHLTVHFPPSGVSIKVKPKQPKAGSIVDLICESSGSNPVSEITWWRNGFELKGRPDGVFNTSYGGRAARNILTLNVTADDDGGVFTCQASNKVLQQSAHDATTLSVLYKPHFVNSVASFDVIEGDSASINLTAKANPPDIMYKWTGPDSQLDSRRFTTNGPFLNVSSVSRSDSGIFRLEASNDEGYSQTEIQLNVKYPASIKKITDLVLADQGKNAYLECQVDANPITPDLITWRRRARNSTSFDDTDVFETLIDEKNTTDSRYKVSLEDNRSFLIISNVSRSDSGLFECVTSNGIGEPTSAIVRLLVKHKPIIDKSPSLLKSAGDEKETGRLYCRAEGAPNVTFIWTREGQQLSDQSYSSTKYSIEPTEQLDLVTYQSVLVINHVTRHDYGPYKCVARNVLGYDSLTVNFTKISKPDTPLALKVINVSHDSVTLKWIPGFDGGLPQSFRIRFNSSLSKASMFSDVYPSNTTSFTISSLTPETQYVFQVMAYNSFGESDFTSDIVKALTPSAPASAGSEGERKVLSQVFAGRAGDLPRLVLLLVMGIGSGLLVLNVFLVVCFIRRKKKNNKRLEEEESDQSSTSKNTGTIEMYAPASGSGGSYNHAATETSLSGSDEENKSDRFSSHFEYGVDVNGGNHNILSSHQTYLVDDNFYPPSVRFSSDPIRFGSRASLDRIHATSTVTAIEPDLTADAYPPVMYASVHRPTSHHHHQHHQYHQHPVQTISASISNPQFYLDNNNDSNGSNSGNSPQHPVPPMPPLRVTNHLNNFSLPAITEEVMAGTSIPVGHLV